MKRQRVRWRDRDRKTGGETETETGGDRDIDNTRELREDVKTKQKIHLRYRIELSFVRTK